MLFCLGSKKGTGWIIKLRAWSVRCLISLTSHHLSAPSCSDRTDISAWAASGMDTTHSIKRKWVEGAAEVPDSHTDPHQLRLAAGICPFMWSEHGNKAVTLALFATFRSSLCKKWDPARNTEHCHWFRVHSHIRSKALREIFLHLDSLSMTNWEFPGTLKLLPTKVSLVTCWRHRILTKAPYQKQSEQKLAWQVQGSKQLNWSVCKIIHPVIED